MFIGSNLCEYLLENGASVTCLDNFITGLRSNIEPFLDSPNFTFIEGDIRNLDDCNKACKGVDFVLHQAALGSVPRSIENPIRTNDININGFLNMLEACKANGIKRFVYAASSSTYGDSKKLPKVEDEIGKPLSPYAVTKYVNELYAHVFSSIYGLETIGLRYFNVFGRRQSPNGAYAAAIPKFVQLMIDHKTPEIHGDGQQSRDFTYIDNVIQANILAGTTTNPEALNKVYNVAYGQRTILLELVEKLKSLLAKFDPEIKDLEIKHVAERVGDVKHSLASIELAQKNLGYAPKYDINSGLEEAIDWYWKELSK